MQESALQTAVIGGGPAGLVAALALARAGHDVTLVDPQPEARPAVGRTTAILAPQAALLRELGAWPGPEAQAELGGLRIVNRGAGAPTDVLFRASELGRPVFGWNVLNAALVDVLATACRGCVEVLPTGLRAMTRRHGRWQLHLDDGRVRSAVLVIGADGKRSAVREALGIGVRRFAYGQAANTALFQHEAPAGDVSVEVHKPGGPFTTVPAGPFRSSLVWLEREAVARRLAALDDVDFAMAIEHESEGRLGHVGAVEGRGLVPIEGLLAERLTAPGALILGEAAHAVSPLGAQGFNLTLRDCRVLFDLARAAGSPEAMARAQTLKDYERRRLAETRAGGWMIDAMNRAVLRPEPILGALRGLALGAVGTIEPLRRQLMQRLLQSQPLALA